MRNSIRKIFNRVITAAILACYGSALIATVYAECYDGLQQWTPVPPTTCGSSIFTSCNQDGCVYFTTGTPCFFCVGGSPETPTGLRLTGSQATPVILFKTTGSCESHTIGCDACDYSHAITIEDPSGAGCRICEFSTEGC